MKFSLKRLIGTLALSLIVIQPAQADRVKDLASAAAARTNQLVGYGIVVGLQGALDFDKGGDIARNLNDLYSYVTRRLFHVNAHNDLEALQEVHNLMNEIRGAWQVVPSLVPPSARTFTPN
jgi:flagellin-specific chaperone FliS